MKQSIKNKIGIYSIIGFLFAGVARAEEAAPFPYYDLEVPIGSKIMIKNIADYVDTVYVWLLGVVGSIVVVMIMYNALKWITAAGSQEKISKAKEGIVVALVGLIIALLGTVLLRTINPDLVTFSGIGPNVISVRGDCTEDENQKFTVGTVCEKHCQCGKMYEDFSGVDVLGECLKVAEEEMKCALNYEKECGWVKFGKLEDGTVKSKKEGGNACREGAVCIFEENDFTSIAEDGNDYFLYTAKCKEDNLITIQQGGNKYLLSDGGYGCKYPFVYFEETCYSDYSQFLKKYYDE